MVAGLQLPVIPFVEVVGSAPGDAPIQYGPNWVNVGVTNGAMLTFTELEPVVQPVELETVTLYVPAVVAVMVCDVAPVFQLYDGYPLPASRTTLPPAQNDNGPEAVILGVITSGST